MQNILEVVHQEHLEMLDLVTEIEKPLDQAPFDAAGRRHLLDRLIALSARHETAERLVVWPLVERHLREGQQLANAGREQETTAEYLLDTLRLTDDGSWTGEATALALSIRRHVDYEENEIWPQLHRSLTRIGAAIAAREFHLAEKVSPTRPHPHGPVRRPGLATIGTIVAGTDRLRDRLHGRHPYQPEREEAAPDAVAFLQADYNQMREVLARLRSSSGGQSREAEAAVVRAWSGHDWMEREHLYPLLRIRLDDGNERYAEWLDQHGRISEQLAAFDRYPYRDEHRTQMIEEAVALVSGHLDDADNVVLPRLRAHLTADELADLGASLAETRRRAPTRAHPHLAGRGSGARVSRAVLRPVDRLRDFVRR